MPDIKISLITVSRNAAGTIRRCIESVIAQNYKNVEYIIVDGASQDDTVKIVDRYKSPISKIISEPDHGIYDAMNRGIKLVSGDVVGMLNADDFFADNSVLSEIANAFETEKAGIVYGDIDYVNKSGKITRRWRSGKYAGGLFNWGWMPPHPTFYCKREFFDQFGLYSLDFGTAADYELMLRFIHTNKMNTFYIRKVMVKMQTGGASNKSIRSRIKGLSFDFKAMQKHGIRLPAVALLLKPLRKIIQYL